MTEDVSKQDVKRTVGKLMQAMPKLNAFESDDGDTFVKVSAFGMDRIFNIKYVRKVFDDTPYEVVHRDRVKDEPGAVNKETDEDPVW